MAWEQHPGLGYNTRSPNNVSTPPIPPAAPSASFKVRPVGGIKNPGALFLVVDTVSMETWSCFSLAEASASWETAQSTEFRHNQKANLLFADGHADSTRNLRADYNNNVSTFQAQW